jgi:dUTP pyrophosphatase
MHQPFQIFLCFSKKENQSGENPYIDFTPSYATSHAAGMDLKANIPAPYLLNAHQRIAIPCGCAIKLEQGFEAQIRPRSGLAIKHGITVLNSPGTIDADYRGEICVILINLSQEAFTLTPGMRIAQMVVAPVIRVEWHPVQSFDEEAINERGSGKFGSTGL